MVPEDLLFWIATLDEAPAADPNVLCVRHADAMRVPRGWTLDDRREDALRLFKPRAQAPIGQPVRTVRQRPRPPAEHRPEQLQIDGTGEIPRPAAATDLADRDDLATDADADPDSDPTTAEETDDVAPWQPDFDEADDLDGLLRVDSPLLARAFRGTDRKRG
jgi:hypothetical protein